MKPKYKVGDKVRIVKKWADGSSPNSQGRMDKWLGKVMTIKSVHGNSGRREFYYDMFEDEGEYFAGNGWMWFEDMIAGIVDFADNEEKIVIFRDGDKVIARHYVGKRIADEAVATCSKADVFDFNYGASLAAHRLFCDGRKNTVLSHFREEISDTAKKLMCVISEMRGVL